MGWWDYQMDQMDFLKIFFSLTSSNVTTLETFQDEHKFVEENYLEPDVTSEIIVQSVKNMYLILYVFN